MKAAMICTWMLLGALSLHAQSDAAAPPVPAPRARSKYSGRYRRRLRHRRLRHPFPATQAPPPTVPGSSAQPVRGADGTYTLRRVSRLVILDVVVTDKQGNVVNGLTREDFHVTELDQPQTLLNFEAAGCALHPDHGRHQLHG